ncbi:AroM family protein, partial [Salmonella enterica]|uniref:AroM family protein n=1 Tax=Salmonella enterica TaxID=28901 RepID=UPI00398C5BC2
ASVVVGHQVGGVGPVDELLAAQGKKWQVLKMPPVYSLANPVDGSEQQLIDAGQALLEQGADVIMLDCLGFHQRHRDILQQSLDVPVLLSTVMISRLAAELLF